MKYCTGCDTLKPITDFFKSNKTNINHVSRCKDCRKKYLYEWRIRNKEQHSEYRKEYYKNMSPKQKKQHQLLSYNNYIKSRDGITSTYVVNKLFGTNRIKAKEIRQYPLLIELKILEIKNLRLIKQLS